MFSPQLINYIIDHQAEEKSSIKSLPVETDEKITDELSQLKNETFNSFKIIKNFFSGVKNKILNNKS